MPELVGRDQECALVAHVLDAARGGTSAAMVVTGQPGIGKTALLRYAAAAADDLTVLWTSGCEAESGLCFAALADVVRPLRSYWSALRPYQAAVLEQALALRAGPVADRFAVGVATLSLLSVAAERRPVLICADDAHAMDPLSLETLRLVARRLVAEGVVMMFGTRPVDPGPLWPPPFRMIELRGLDREAAWAVATRASAVRPAAGVLQRLFADSQGNPLALLEIPTQLSPGQLAGIEPLPEPLPAGPTLDGMFRTRIAALPAETRQALLVAAVSGQGDLHAIARALDAAGLRTAALEPAESAGLIGLDGARLTFGHPLIRASACGSATPADRRAAHRAAAGACTDPGTLERRAYHLAEAALAPDEEVAALLARAAAQAESRGGYAIAADGFGRAARLSPPGEGRAQRLVAAARATQLANQMEASRDLIEQALAQTEDPRLRTDSHVLLARSLVWTGQAGPGHRILAAEVDGLERADPRRAALLLADAALPCFLTRDIAAAIAVARRAHELARGLDATARFAAAAALGAAMMFAGQSAACEPLLVEAGRLVAGEMDPTVLGLNGVAHAVMVAKSLMWLERFDETRLVFDRTGAAARARSAPGFLPFLLSAQGDFAYLVGDWPTAVARSGEAVRLGDETGETGQRAYALSGLARLAAAQGRVADCHQQVTASLEFAERSDLRTMQIRGIGARGLSLLGQGQYERAAGVLGQLVGGAEPFDVREPSLLVWVPDLIEAYARCRRRAPAERLLAQYAAVVERVPRRSALATVHRCQGLFAAGGAAVDHFDAALAFHAQATVPFEAARTELCKGEWLRRSGQRAAARRPLRTALATFDRLEANPWSARARAELRATGESPQRRPRAPQMQTLTPQETAVATAVASGMTNQEAADALFLSAKTVAFHLTHVYRKLGLRSRAQLARRFAAQRGEPET
jgi:DNA-binding CsgD family transcriptional regulator